MKRVLISIAHSDDETIGCGGTIAKHVSQGDKVFCISMTDGVGARFKNSADLKHTSSEIEANMEELKDDLEKAMIALQEKIDKQIKSALSNPLSQM